MNHLKYISFLIVVLHVFSSCEDVIELDLETTESQLVIEATLDAGNKVASVALTKTNDFYDNSSLEKVSGATITLQDENGNSYSLLENSDGVYLAENVEASEGDFFSLSIEIEGEVYQATSQVPSTINLKEIMISEASNNPFGNSDDGNIMLSAIWDDPSGTENFYRIRSYIDEVFLSDTYTLLTDNFSGDGKEQTIPIRNRFEEGTKVTLELLSTDENYYDYFFQISSVVGDGNNSTTPYNPVGNFDKDVLGFFGIFYASALSVEL